MWDVCGPAEAVPLLQSIHANFMGVRTFKDAGVDAHTTAGRETGATSGRPFRVWRAGGLSAASPRWLIFKRMCGALIAGVETPAYHPGDEDPSLHPTDEDLSLGAPSRWGLRPTTSASLRVDFSRRG